MRTSIKDGLDWLLSNICDSRVGIATRTGMKQLGIRPKVSRKWHNLCWNSCKHPVLQSVWFLLPLLQQCSIQMYLYSAFYNCPLFQGSFISNKRKTQKSENIKYKEYDTHEICMCVYIDWTYRIYMYSAYIFFINI